jgi:hypothetical protein
MGERIQQDPRCSAVNGYRDIEPIFSLVATCAG